jgi:hypothetical protein
MRVFVIIYLNNRFRNFSINKSAYLCRNIKWNKSKMKQNKDCSLCITNIFILVFLNKLFGFCMI